jgi:glycogen operon protein
MDGVGGLQGTWWGARWNAAEAAWELALWSHHADAVQLVVCHRRDPFTPVVERRLHRDGDRWTLRLPLADVGDADLYGYRVAGRWAPSAGHRFDPAKLLVDPWAVRVWVPPSHDRDLARIHGSDTLGRSLFGVLPDPQVARVSTVRPLDRPGGRAPAPVIVEAHVRGATMQPSSGVAEGRRGTFAGLGELVPYLRDLGADAIELLPIHQLDPAEGNYWGYMPHVFGALNDRYVAGPDPDDELRRLVDRCHEEGIEVLVDVVYNHTGEDGVHGPTYSLRGIDNASYYALRPGGGYRDDAGCGNILRAAHPAAGALVLGTLERFADLGVDGFRFDLATILGRDLHGNLQARSELLDAISALAEARGLRLIAEPWDLSAYQVGESFPGRGWAQWNGRFRDDVRSFVRGEPGMVAALVQRVQGSPDLFPGRPRDSVNFVTCHDGFTLHDLVAYDHKHNEANGHGNTDGTDHNRSWNCGWEGDDGAPAEVVALRRQQMRNLIGLLLLSSGTPMLMLGDEIAQTQRGNNNPYNQDNPLTWIDWGRAREWGDLRRFVRTMIAQRRAHPSIDRGRPWGEDVTFHGVSGPPDLSFESRSLAWLLRGAPVGDDDLYVIVNAWWEPLTFHLPEAGPWWRIADTALRSPADVAEPGAEPPVSGDTYHLAPRSLVVLVRRRAT